MRAKRSSSALALSSLRTFSFSESRLSSFSARYFAISCSIKPNSKSFATRCWCLASKLAMMVLKLFKRSYFASSMLSHGSALSSTLSPVSEGSIAVGYAISGTTPLFWVLPPSIR
ncbi:Uncharacterised protein [Vibrio cholerae]|nr:Uncharacterised protein [Vibrio cholerae]